MKENNILNHLSEGGQEVKSVLIVEDEYVSRQLLSKLLSSHFNVDSAENSEECLSKISERKYSLIFMDINLGAGMTGLDTIKFLRKDIRFKEVPIVATTAFAMPGDKEEFIEAGCTNYLSKPFSKENLFSLLNELNL